MSEVLFSEGWLCLGSYDISGTEKGFPFKVSQDIKEWICFLDPSLGAGSQLGRKRLPSTPNAEIPVDGYLDFQGNYLATQDAIGSGSVVVTFGPLRTPGMPVELITAIMADRAMGGAVGEVCPFATNLQASGLIASGKLFEFSDLSADGPGAIQTLPAVANNQTLVAHLHSCQVPGGTSPTMDVVLKRSATGAFAGEEITVATFTQVTGLANQRIEVAGPITDTKYRFFYDLGGTGGVFRTRTAVGIA